MAASIASTSSMFSSEARTASPGILSAATNNSWNRCYDFKNIFVKKFSKNIGFFRTTASFRKKMIITLVFEKNANFFRQNFSKIAENCDHNIDPWNQFYELPSFVTEQTKLDKGQLQAG
jgi:hypothetical protein